MPTPLQYNRITELVRLLDEVDDLVGHVPTEIKMLVIGMATSEDPVDRALTDLREIAA